MSKIRKKNKRKLFVLDTNVLLHDPQCLFRFDEHDIYIPMVTLEEVDAHKKGLTDIARNARQSSRYLDELIDRSNDVFHKGIALNRSGHIEARGHLFLQTALVNVPMPTALNKNTADNQILSVVKALREKTPYACVVLVSKDINIRIKARSLGLDAEDYNNDKVLEDSDLLYCGFHYLDSEFWLRNGKNLHSWQENDAIFYEVHSKEVRDWQHNEWLIDLHGEKPLQTQVINIAGNKALLKTVRDYSSEKNTVWGIKARNIGQNQALNLLMNPEIDLITLLGQAGTGKTLLTLAAALTQTLDDKRYNEIIMTRVTIPVGEDIGFLPGTEEEKMNPWMGALEDNLEVLSHSDEGGDWARGATQDIIRSRIKIKSLNFMRGRTFQNKFLIIDEAQNLTPKQMKTLITRAGKGTKVVCLGNLAQIDSPYLTEGNSGLTFTVDRFKNWPHFGHVTLQQGERSRLADYAIGVL